VATYFDEHGGFYDHVSPPQAPQGSARTYNLLAAIEINALDSHVSHPVRYTIILGESRSFWRKANEDQTIWQDGPHDCSEGWTRSAPSCEGRAPNCPHAWCSDLRLGKGEGRRPEGLAASHAAVDFSL
jgi:hypothetical protein